MNDDEPGTALAFDPVAGLLGFVFVNAKGVWADPGARGVVRARAARRSAPFAEATASSAAVRRCQRTGMMMGWPKCWRRWPAPTRP